MILPQHSIALFVTEGWFFSYLLVYFGWKKGGCIYYYCYISLYTLVSTIWVFRYGCFL